MVKGWSFLKHPDNGLDRKRAWIFERVLTESKLWERFVRGTTSGSNISLPRMQWRDRGVFEYMQAVRGFREKLFVLVHMTEGAPARG